MPQDRDDLYDTLRAENTALRSFMEVLREEQQLLIRGKIDQLAACAEPKARWLLELNRLGEQRLQILRGHGVTPDRAGMEEWLNTRYSGHGETVEQWQQLLQLATAANQTNTSNGLLISARTNTTQRALSALFASARLPAAYTSDGGTVGYHAAQRIAVA